jgi:large subunit ribosomal protein L9
MEAEQQVQSKRKRLERIMAKRLEEMKEMVERLNGVSITISAKADGEKLYGSIGPKEIATALAAEHKVEVPESAIVLESPLKTVGVCDITLRPTPDSSAVIKVWIVAESGDESGETNAEPASAQQSAEIEKES